MRVNERAVRSVVAVIVGQGQVYTWPKNKFLSIRKQTLDSMIVLRLFTYISFKYN